MSLIEKEIESAVLNEQLDFIEMQQEDWRKKKFSNSKATINIATLFSGIGSIEHSLKRLKLKHKIVFAGDIDKKIVRLVILPTMALLKTTGTTT